MAPQVQYSSVKLQGTVTAVVVRYSNVGIIGVPQTPSVLYSSVKIAGTQPVSTLQYSGVGIIGTAINGRTCKVRVGGVWSDRHAMMRKTNAWQDLDG